MTRELFFQAIFKFLAGAVLLFLLIFLPAGALDYWNAWLLMGILFVPMFLAGIVLRDTRRKGVRYGTPRDGAL